MRIPGAKLLTLYSKVSAHAAAALRHALVTTVYDHQFRLVAASAVLVDSNLQRDEYPRKQFARRRLLTATIVAKTRCMTEDAMLRSSQLSSSSADLLATRHSRTTTATHRTDARKMNVFLWSVLSSLL